MTLTFIETPGHGYLKVSKEQFIESGADIHKVSMFSGLTKTHVFLEEDCDATYFINHLKQNGIPFEENKVYQETLSTTHNYNPYNF
jgi:hypothetical protein